jgi:colanic acid/amylovoran biosynthesis glycosyltransferase
LDNKPRTIALLFTTFPKTSETFLQRDVAALQASGLNLRLYSLWGGGGEFRGMPVRTFNKWKLVPLFAFIIPWNCLRRPRIVRDLFEGVIMRRPPGWMNFWENMLGAGFAGCFYREFRADPPVLVHGAWAGAPATAGWLLWRILGIPYSTGAHAYDLYEHGGDWWLMEKLALARFIHTSTEMGRALLIERGADVRKIHVIRRGLDVLPVFKALRPGRTPLRLICIARLVPKKGLRHQLKIYAALREAGLAFEARIIGDGPLRDSLEAEIARLGLATQVKLLGHLSHAEVWPQLSWADVLLHTGIVAPSGDRDGLPNVIPEAMAAGVLVVTSPVSATTEAIHQQRTGLVADVDLPLAWQVALRQLATDDALAERLRIAARHWVEENYDAHKNTARLAECFERALSP